MMAKDVFDENKNNPLQKNKSYCYTQTTDCEQHSDYKHLCNEQQPEHAIIVNIEDDDAEQTEKTPAFGPASDLSLATLSTTSSVLSLTYSTKRIMVAVMFLIIAVLFNLTILAVIHERVPMDEPPLPDISFSLLPKNDKALDVSEYIIMFMCTTTVLMIVLHRYRSILIRRLCLMLGLLYLFRAICMGVTQLPVANKQYYCSPKLNQTRLAAWWELIPIILTRVTHMSLGMGLSVNGKHSFCGDYIFSGHTVVLVITYLMLNQYLFTGVSAKDKQKRTQYLVLLVMKYTYLLLVLTGLLCILVARGHYLVDIVLAYFITSRIFYIYHTACTMEAVRQAYSPTINYSIQNIWWYRLYRFVEHDTIHHQIEVVNSFDCPSFCFNTEDSSRKY